MAQMIISYKKWHKLHQPIWVYSCTIYIPKKDWMEKKKKNETFKNITNSATMKVLSFSKDKSGTTVMFLNIRTPKKFVVITLKFELCGSTIE